MGGVGWHLSIPGADFHQDLVIRQGMVDVTEMFTEEGIRCILDDI